MIRGPKKSVGVLMSIELYDQVKEQAGKTGKTIPGYIRQVLKRYLWHVKNRPETLIDEWNIW